MVSLKLVSVASFLLVTMSLQGCMLSPTLPDPDQQQAALERWSRCLQRFDVRADHFCDGHRRDVLATYPAHLENQINSMLSHQTNLKRTSQLLKTGLRYVPAATEQRVLNALIDASGGAKNTDL